MVDEPTRDELIRMVNRDRLTKEILSNRIAALSLENAELIAMVREMQRIPSVNPQEVDGDPST